MTKMTQSIRPDMDHGGWRSYRLPHSRTVLEAALREAEIMENARYPHHACFPACKQGISTKLRQPAFISAMILALLGASGDARAEGLAGSWNGAGWVLFAGGSQERAHCRARYRATSASSYVLNATCATASGSITQDASLRRVGTNNYTGGFYNSEYNVSGTIHVTVRGNSQSVSIDSDSGSASISLSR
jgi:hypothetical protein